MSYIKENHGRFHMRNNTKTYKNNGYVSLKINRQEPTFISFRTPDKIDILLKTTIDIGLSVLNDYFNRNSPLHLGKYKPISNDNMHRCTSRIKNEFKYHARLKINNTRKASRY